MFLHLSELASFVLAAHPNPAPYVADDVPYQDETDSQKAGEEDPFGVLQLEFQNINFLRNSAPGYLYLFFLFLRQVSHAILY